MVHLLNSFNYCVGLSEGVAWRNAAALEPGGSARAGGAHHPPAVHLTLGHLAVAIVAIRLRDCTMSLLSEGGGGLTQPCRKLSWTRLQQLASCSPSACPLPSSCSEQPAHPAGRGSYLGRSGRAQQRGAAEGRRVMLAARGRGRFGARTEARSFPQKIPYELQNNVSAAGLQNNTFACTVVVHEHQ